MLNICIWGTSLKKVADEAQLLALTKAVKEKVPNAGISIFVHNGNLIKKHFDDIKTTETANIFKVSLLLAKCDLFIIVGGPFMEYKQQMLSCFILILISKLFRKPIVTYGTTLFEYKTTLGKYLFRFLFNRIDCITVREEVCKKLLNELGVKKDVLLFPDPRFILDPISFADIKNILIGEGIDIDRPIIGITTRHLHENIPEWVKRSHGYTEELANNVYEVIGKTLNDQGQKLQYIIIPMHPSYQDDLKTFEKIKKHMTNPSSLKILSKQYRSLELIGIIGACKLIISSRLGSSIFATTTSTPLVSIAYESRMIDHMDNIGLDKFAFDWKELSLNSFSCIFGEVLSNHKELKENLGTKIENLRNKARQNIDVIDYYYKK